jgi:hypothetical protein
MQDCHSRRSNSNTCATEAFVTIKALARKSVPSWRLKQKRDHAKLMPIMQNKRPILSQPQGPAAHSVPRSPRSGVPTHYTHIPQTCNSCFVLSFRPTNHWVNFVGWGNIEKQVKLTQRVKHEWNEVQLTNSRAQTSVSCTKIKDRVRRRECTRSKVNKACELKSTWQNTCAIRMLNV